MELESAVLTGMDIASSCDGSLLLEDLASTSVAVMELESAVLTGIDIASSCDGS